jgi:uncharacterized membrane protein YqjE
MRPPCLYRNGYGETMIPSTTDRLDGAEPTIGQLVAAIKDDVTGLVRGELDLAKAELRDQAKAGGASAGMFGAAALLALVGFVLVSVAAAYGLHALGLGLGWSLLIVGGVYVVIAGALVAIGKNGFSKVQGPERAQQQAKEIAASLKHSTGR